MPYEGQLKFKQWSEPAKQIMETSQYYQDRMKFELTNKYVCLLWRSEISICDPVSQKHILTVPLPTGFRAYSGAKLISVSHKIVLLNLRYNDHKPSTKILIYDLSFNTWKQGAECPHFRSHYKFSCCASPEGSIYTAGGFDGTDLLSEAAVYKVNEDKWEILPNMHQSVGFSTGVFMEGMFYVIGDRPREGTQRFDPITRVWTTIDNMSLNHHHDVLYAFGRLIAFELYNRRGVINEYDWEENAWRQFDLMPPNFDFNIATVWCDGMFFYREFPQPALSNTWTPNHFAFNFAPVWCGGMFFYGDFQQSCFYIYRPRAALSNRWTPIHLDTKFIWSMTAIEI